MMPVLVLGRKERKIRSRSGFRFRLMKVSTLGKVPKSAKVGGKIR